MLIEFFSKTWFNFVFLKILLHHCVNIYQYIHQDWRINFPKNISIVVRKKKLYFKQNTVHHLKEKNNCEN